MERFKVIGPAAQALRRVPAFIDPAAVEAWDAWFRWRERGVLRDLTIEDTWSRIVATLASVEPAAHAEGFARRLADALASWRLLLDERIVAGAGTGRTEWPTEGLEATLNLAAFVRAPFTSAAQFDRAAFADAVDLAIRALDNAALLAGANVHPRDAVRVGVAGLADALALLGTPYDSDAGRDFARETARALAEACLRGSARLAAERGSALANRIHAVERANALGASTELVATIRRHGLRFERHTAVALQPKLALFANHVAEALDPLPPEGEVWVDAPLGGIRAIRSAGFAATLRRRVESPGAIAPGEIGIGVPGQIEMRAAVAPWIDAPIDYPFRVAHAPDAATLSTWCALASARGLMPPAWRPAALNGAARTD